MAFSAFYWCKHPNFPTWGWINCFLNLLQFSCSLGHIHFELKLNFYVYYYNFLLLMNTCIIFIHSPIFMYLYVYCKLCLGRGVLHYLANASFFSHFNFESLERIWIKKLFRVKYCIMLLNQWMYSRHIGETASEESKNALKKIGGGGSEQAKSLFNPFMHGVHYSGQTFGSQFEPFKFEHHLPNPHLEYPQSLVYNYILLLSLYLIVFWRDSIINSKWWG